MKNLETCSRNTCFPYGTIRMLVIAVLFSFIALLPSTQISSSLQAPRNHHIVLIAKSARKVFLMCKGLGLKKDDSTIAFSFNFFFNNFKTKYPDHVYQITVTWIQKKKIEKNKKSYTASTKSFSGTWNNMLLFNTLYNELYFFGPFLTLGSGETTDRTECIILL